MTSLLSPDIPLRDGHRIPQLGLGTWQLTGEACTQAVSEAIEMGYRHIDTAIAYRNHIQVGNGIKRSGVERESLYVTTKIPLGKQSRDQVIQQTGQALKDLQLSYLDLLLIHWPDKTKPFSETLSAMHELVEKKRVRSIGISNFNKRITMDADACSPSPIVTNQVEFHPYLYQKELLELCRSRDIRITAYSPLAKGRVFDDPTLEAIAGEHGASVAQICLAWLLSKGIIAIPKASSAEHIRANLESVKTELADDQIERIDGLDKHIRLIDGDWKHYPLEV